MKAPEFVLDIFLQPGDLYFGDRDTRVRTLLGSCVAITLWHPKRLIGGMCHYLLPEHQPKNAGEALNGRYADEALLLFLREIDNSKTLPSEYEVKMFGGGNQFPGHNASRKLNVADKNIQIGKTLLLQHGFKLASWHLGGNGHRNVMLDIWSGHVWMQHING